MVDAVVIGAGPNGLVAANHLADAGWDVLVLEEQAWPGGAARTAELTVPGFKHDLFSAFYPLSPRSPALAPLKLYEHGLNWKHMPLVVAHPSADGSCASLSRDLDETAASLDAFAPGDGDAWRRLYALWERVGGHLVDALFTPFPPVRAGLRMLAALGSKDEILRFLRFSVVPVRRLGEEEFSGAGGPRLLAGNALHADLTPESSAGGMYGWLLCGLGQEVGYPVPEGGAGELTGAMARRLEAVGGTIECGARVERVLMRGGRAVGVRTADGREIGARKAVVADTGAPQLYLELVGEQHLPPKFVADLQRFEYDTSTVKIDWALDKPIPWTAADARRAGTVHVTDSVDSLTVLASELARGLLPSRPFLVMGQYSMGDPTRMPAGAETAWAYTHVPQKVRGDAGPDGLTGSWDERETELFATRVEAEIERLAPGFRDLVRGRHVFTPRTMEQADRNLVNGAVNSGTAQIHQQVVFRPTPGLARPETPVKGLYLGSASAHPGGGVHGAPGANAARAALLGADRRRKAVALGAAAAGAAALARAARD